MFKNLKLVYLGCVVIAGLSISAAGYAYGHHNNQSCLNAVQNSVQHKVCHNQYKQIEADQKNKQGFCYAGNPVFIYKDTKVADFECYRERILFEKDLEDNLLMIDKSTGKEIMRFAGHYGDNGGIAYAVRQVRLANPDKVFYEIIANQGAHGRNAGVWVVGKYRGEWARLVTIPSLALAGYDADGWHIIKTDITEDGRYILTSCHEYMPEGAVNQYERKYVDDFCVELKWDKFPAWIALERLDVQN